MHKWIRISSHGTVWPFEYLLRNNDIVPEWWTDSLRLILVNDEDEQILLHFTAMYGEDEVAQILVEAYEQERAKETSIFPKESLVPWLQKNNKGQTPLDMAIEKDDGEEVALCFLTPEINSVLQVHNPLFLAIDKKRYKVAQRMLDKQEQLGWSLGLSSGRGRNVLHDASYYTENRATWLVTNLPHFISKPDDDGRTPLHEASKAGKAWLIVLMLNTDHFSLRKAPLAWVEACSHISTINAFINNCAYFRDHCLHQNDTPLHHIKLRGYTEYKEFLEIPIINELKNTQNSDGETPLHRAVFTANMCLASRNITQNTRNRFEDQEQFQQNCVGVAGSEMQ